MKKTKKKTQNQAVLQWISHIKKHTFTHRQNAWAYHSLDQYDTHTALGYILYNTHTVTHTHNTHTYFTEPHSDIYRQHTHSVVPYTQHSDTHSDTQ